MLVAGSLLFNVSAVSKTHRTATGRSAVVQRLYQQGQHVFRYVNVGAVISLGPNLKPVTDLLGADEATVKKVLASWGPSKFAAQLFLDGKAFTPDGKSGATLIPAAYGLDGVNLATYTGFGQM